MQCLAWTSMSTCNFTYKTFIRNKSHLFLIILSLILAQNASVFASKTVSCSKKVP